VRFARRLALGTLAVVTLTVAVLLFQIERVLRRDLEAGVASALESEARLVREALPADHAGWQATIRRFALQTGTRITVIDQSGLVIADSDFPDLPLPTLENHRDRPEVSAALQGRSGRAKRESATVGRELMYVAVPAGTGVVRVAEDLGHVDAIVRRTQLSAGGAALLALIVGLAGASVVARGISRPLIGLSSAAQAIAEGAAPRFPRSGVREVDALVRSLREMHRQLDQRFQELRRERSGSSALVEAMVEGVLAADARGHITTANGAARRLLGYEPDAPLPDLPELFRARDAQELVQAALGGATEGSRTLELDGKVLLATARALPDGGAVLVLHDLTELRRLEAIRRDFVANVSHELKTPLTSISGYSETLLADRPDAETTQRFLEIILGNARRMQHLVDDLLDLARIESGRWLPSPTAVDAGAIARDVWLTLAEGGTRGSAVLQLDVPPGTSLHADPDAIRQVLTNLLDNALRYTPAGGAITVSLQPDQHGMRLDVSDTGAGIAREHLPRIFERFYRVDASRSRGEGGTGLGLSIVRHLVESHGGRVFAESVPGEGTTISCWFPEPAIVTAS
jgi:two-component system phosphate regulon sensor histidine kinase PhoR